MTQVKSNELEKVGAVTQCQANPASYSSYMGGSYGYLPKPSAKRIAAHALSQLEQARQKDVEAHERNLPKIAANKAARERIEALMKEVGMPDSFYVVPHNTRARFPKKVKQSAGYIVDMQRHLPITDGFDQATATYNTLKARYDLYAKEAEGEDERLAAEAERERQRKLETQRNNIQMAKIIIRYDLPEDSSWHDILDALRKKDQRIDLAVAMAQTRGDWSEGYHRVSDALDRFIVRTPEDAAIQTDILSCFNDDIDGRVFRDTTWNYDRLFSSVTEDHLADDARTAMSHIID